MPHSQKNRHSDGQIGRFCQGCGADLPPKTWRGPDRKWCSEHCRKSQYGSTCIDCGAPTDGSNGRERAPERCMECLTWTEEKVIEVLQAWAAEHGRSPRLADCRPGEPGYGVLPNTSGRGCIRRHFGSWNKALAAAGLGVNQDKSDETFEAMRAAIVAGEPTKAVARRFGVSSNAVHNRMRTHGVRVSELRRAA